MFHENMLSFAGPTRLSNLEFRASRASVGPRSVGSLIIGNMGEQLVFGDDEPQEEALHSQVVQMDVLLETEVGCAVGNRDQLEIEEVSR